MHTLYEQGVLIIRIPEVGGDFIIVVGDVTVVVGATVSVPVRERSLITLIHTCKTPRRNAIRDQNPMNDYCMHAKHFCFAKMRSTRNINLQYSGEKITICTSA